MILTRPIYRVTKPVAPEQTFRIPKGGTSYLKMSRCLIQGARPEDQAVLAAENHFQGGYRCTLKIITPPVFGTVVISDNQIGFDYTPMSKYWMGKDSFSYSVVNVMGYESDAKCVYILIGL